MMPPPTHHRARGHTLPELLVGLGIGLVVVAAAATVLGISRQTWFTQNAAESLHANARSALRAIRTQALMAGAVDVISLPSLSPNQWQLETPYSASQADISGTAGNKSQRSLTLGRSSSVDSRDCQGNYHNKLPVVLNQFKFNSSNDFSCKDLNESGSTFQALAEGVEDMQVRYAQANTTQQTLQWLDADQVSQMSNVMAIEVCLRVASANNVQAAQPSTPLLGCSGEKITHDGKLRRVFRRVYLLRHHREVMP